MDNILYTLIVSFCTAFICRNMAMMTNYCLQYGQIFGNIKLWIASRIEPDVVQSIRNNSSKQSEAEDQAIEIYDMLCDYKTWDIYPANVRTWSALLSLLDCAYCIGFWISMITSCVVVPWMGCHIVAYLLIPVLTFFCIEKV